MARLTKLHPNKSQAFRTSFGQKWRCLARIYSIIFDKNQMQQINTTHTSMKLGDLWVIVYEVK